MQFKDCFLCGSIFNGPSIVCCEDPIEMQGIIIIHNKIISHFQHECKLIRLSAMTWTQREVVQTS